MACIALNYIKDSMKESVVNVHMIYDQEIVIKTGQKCILRSPRKEDAKQILSLMEDTSGETEYMLRYPEEFQLTVEDEESILEQIVESSNVIMVAAEIDGVIVANGGIHPVGTAQKTSHRAEFGISIRKEYWGMGIGSAILEAIKEQAAIAGYEQIELDVVPENMRAISLYEKFGFRQCGTIPHGFKCRGERYLDLNWMVCPI